MVVNDFFNGAASRAGVAKSEVEKSEIGNFLFPPVELKEPREKLSSAVLKTGCIRSEMGGQKSEISHYLPSS